MFFPRTQNRIMITNARFETATIIVHLTAKYKDRTQALRPYNCQEMT